MERYEDKIENALQQLWKPSSITPTGGNPIVYLTYHPEDVIKVRDLSNTFLPSKAKYYGFDVIFVSLGELIDKFITDSPYRDLWLSPIVDEMSLYNSIRQELDKSQFLESELLRIQDEQTNDHSLLVIKDVEMLHPLHMMGAIENRIYNKIRIPMMVLYPGDTQGKLARSFLNVYNQDGNYRSINV